MTFDKTKYWKNRSGGKRGQGEYQVPGSTERDVKGGSHILAIGGKIIAVNRATARRRVADRRLTSKTARTKSDEESKAVVERVKRKGAGERRRIELKRERAAR